MYTPIKRRTRADRRSIGTGYCDGTVFKTCRETWGSSKKKRSSINDEGERSESKDKIEEAEY